MSIVEKLRKIKDYGGSMTHPPKHSEYMVKDSTLRGNFLVTDILYDEISPEIDFGENIQKIFNGENGNFSSIEKSLGDFIESENSIYSRDMITQYQYFIVISGILEKSKFKNTGYFRPKNLKDQEVVLDLL